MRKMEYGDWAQVIGTFDSNAGRGQILSMQPSKVAFASIAGGEERVRLKGFDADGGVLFDLAVNPMAPSCGNIQSSRMFQEFVPIHNQLKEIRLYIDGGEAATFAPGMAQQHIKLSLGKSLAGKLHRIPIEVDGVPPAEANVTYLLQVRPEGDERWHTMATGMDRPDAVEVDINQFPGAKALSIRILRTNGLTTTTVLETRREF
ncbi:hypothetical protein [Pseudomonas donghuensis]|uniref:hypothetical protein n=1 Tax=Pseudomonas donghuensis TaxID=1163398 RepID=UPI002E14D102|nr:hypothetical protein VP780_12760 [Pseudomonas donghuensis]